MKRFSFTNPWSLLLIINYIIIMAYIEIIEGINRGAVLRLRAENFIGRSSENAINLPDTEVSRQHAVIRVKGKLFHGDRPRFGKRHAGQRPRASPAGTPTALRR